MNSIMSLMSDEAGYGEAHQTFLGTGTGRIHGGCKIPSIDLRFPRVLINVDQSALFITPCLPNARKNMDPR